MRRGFPSWTWVCSAFFVMALCVPGCSNEDDEDRLEEIRLFATDTTANLILELKAKNGKVINSFLAPGTGITGPRCGLAYDHKTETLFFHDPDAGLEIWAIDPDDPDPTGTATALPNLAPSMFYDGLGHDGTFLLAQNALLDAIDFLDPVTGAFVKSEMYSQDLEGGFDADSADDSVFYATGLNVLNNWEIKVLDRTGGIPVVVSVLVPGFQPRGLGFARDYMFAADMGNFQILVINWRNLDIVDSFPISGATGVCALAAGKKKG